MSHAKEKQVSRRAFLMTAGAAACGTYAFLSFGRPGAVYAAKPGMVTIVQFGADGKSTGKVQVPRVIKTDAEWKQQLSPLSYEVARKEGTERPFTGDTLNVHDKGIFRCVCCDNALFSSQTKFDSGTGWPSFWEPIARENVIETSDQSLGMARTAVSCRECDAHLGHVFDDGPRPTGLRYCMNSASMHFTKQA